MSIDSDDLIEDTSYDLFPSLKFTPPQILSILQLCLIEPKL